MMSAETLGIIAVLAGLALSALVYAILRAAAHLRPNPPEVSVNGANVSVINDAVMVIQTGGRVSYANAIAREWFDEHTTDELNIERLVRRVRPGETFWQLCRSEGQARLSLNGKVIEATSYRIASDASVMGGNEAVLISMREMPSIEREVGDTSRLTNEVLLTFAELTQSIATHTTIEKTLEAILDSLERLVPADMAEITVWDAANQCLVPYRFTGVSGVDRQLEKVMDTVYRANEGYSGYLITHRSPLLIHNVETFRNIRLSVKRVDYPFRSYLGVPLLVGGHLVGTLEMASLAINAFGERDLEMATILAGQAAVGLYNAILLQDEQDRGRELAGLAQIAHAVGASGDQQDLFARLVESIKPLLDVKSLGFLIYDANRRNLEAQRPFIGIPDQTIGLYRIHITPGTPAEEVWLAQATIVSTDASDDPSLAALGLDSLATAAGIVQTVLVPLTVSGRCLGYLQVGDKTDNTPFSDDDVRLVEIMAGQTATIIENANLVQQTQERAQRAEALRRIASLTGSVATLDEILQFSLRELAQLLRADWALIFLLDQDRGGLNLHTASSFGPSPHLIADVSQLSLESQNFRTTVTARQDVYFSGNAQTDDTAKPFYTALVQKLGIRSLVVVPLIIRGRGVGELLLGSRQADFFHRSDVGLVVTTASQLTVAIEKSQLLGQTDESLRRRVEQLTALANIGREINSTLELSATIQLVYDELLRITQADCGNICLFEAREPAIYPTNDTPLKISLLIGDDRPHRLSEIEASVVEKDDILVIADFLRPQDAPGEAVTMEAPHGYIRSALLAPIHYQGQIAGLIHLHGRAPNLFDEAALEIVQAMATQAAIALGNAQRYQEHRQRNELLSRRVETLSKLFETTRSVHVEQPLDDSLETIAYAIQEATPFNVVLISTYDQRNQQLMRRAGVGLPLDVMGELRSRSQSWQVIAQFISPEFRVSHSYFVPRDRRPVKPAELHVEIRQHSTFDVNGDRWHAEDILFVPMYDGQERPLGLISVDAPRNGLRPDRPTIEALEVFASQAAFIIESWSKLDALHVHSSALQKEMDQLRLSANASINLAQVQLPLMLHKDVEQTLAIQRLGQRVRRIRAGLDIAELVNQQNNRENVLLALGQEMLARLEMDVALVAEPLSGGPHLLYALGEIPANANPEPLLGQRNPLRLALQNGTLIHAENLESSEWRSTPLLQALDAKSFLCLPIQVEQGIDAAVLVTSRKPLPQITQEDEQVFHLVARQVAIALQNLRLLTETNRRLQEVNLLLDFSRQLGSLEPVSILKTLVESAMKVLPAAHAVMVALWQPDESVLLPQYAAGYRDDSLILQIPYHSGEALPGRVFEQGQAQLVEQVDFARQYNLPPESLLRYRDATAGLPLSSLIVPIQTMENKLGVMVLDNFKEPGAFTPDDMALVSSLTQQTALALENARLFQSAEQRTAQLQALTNVAATITSSLQTDELITSLLDQMKTILPYETGTLWLRQGQQMTVRAARGFEDSDERVGLSVTITDSLLLAEMLQTSQPISAGDVREDIRFPSLLEPRYFSWLGVPLLSKGEVVGVIALEKQEANFYTHEHVQAAMTFAGQASVALQNANLFEESARRAVELNDRSQRLALLNRLSADLSSSLDAGQILTMGLHELIQAINGTAGAAVLFDETAYGSLVAEIPQRVEALPARLPQVALFDRLRESLGIFSAEDVRQEAELKALAAFFENHQARAILVLPLATGSDVHGMLLVYQDQEYRFSPDEVELARTIGNQVAVAIQNAQLFSETQRLFAETRQHSAELALLFEMGVNISQVLDQQKLMEATFENVIQLTRADAVVVALVNDDNTFTVNGLDQGERLGPIKREMTGQSYSEAVLKSGSPVLIHDTQSEQEEKPAPEEQIGEPVRCWLGVPLTVRGAAIGVISVQSYQPNMFDIATQRLLVQVANQLAIAFDNARLLGAAQDYAANLEKSVNERTEQLAREHRRTQTLLGIISELSTSLDLDLVLNRTLRVINDTLGSEHSLIMLINPDEATLQLRASLGYSAPVPKGGIASTLKVNEGLAGWVIGNRQAALIPDLWEDWRWVRRDDQTELHRSAIAVPLVIGEENLGAMLLFHRHPNFFTPDQLELVQATAKQIAVALNNAQLFRLIRDQAERLGDMLRTQHVETSRSQAILEAVADGVLVTDVQGKITLFNDSAEKVLGLGRQQVLGRSLEHFLGLFGNAGQTWVETIRTWSEDPTTYKPGDIYAEQIELDNRRVVAVHLSPVRLRSDFLGTVSIFRDITHMVEVDRLKSEFVATVSHELRTPMTSIKGYVDVMLMGATGQLSEQQSHFLKIVKSNTERLAILVNDLLDISRIEAGRATLSMQPVDLAKVIETSVNDLMRRMQEENRPIKIDMSVQPDLPHPLGDTERIRQVVDNLLENAYQYTPVDEWDGLIRIHAYQNENEIQVDVTDNGIGISAEEQERVFERFYRGEDPLVLATSGTGLGLSIVQRLIEMHNGRIWMESTGVRGEGSTFSFTLPVAPHTSTSEA